MTTNADLLNEIRNLSESINRLNLSLALLEARLQDVEKTTECNKSAIEGNGKEGIKTTLAIIKHNQDKFAETLDRRSTREWALIVIGIGLLADAIIPQFLHILP